MISVSIPCFIQFQTFLTFMSFFCVCVKGVIYFKIVIKRNFHNGRMDNMPASFWWRDPGIAVSYEAMPLPGKYRSRCSQLSIRQNTGPPTTKLEKAPKELKGSATLQVEQQYELTSTPWALAAQAAEDGLVSHHWEERPLGIANFICPSTAEFQGQEVGVGG
jgi:hypothetical protein